MSCSRFITGALAALLLASRTTGHMIMLTPTPYANTTVDSEPLGGGDFPCKKGLGFEVAPGGVTKMAVGDTQTLQFRAYESAVHGGGSCQMSITLDKEPTANSKFKVIHSMEGACPGLGSTPHTFDYKVPASVPDGEATIAWTWFSKLSGAPELYMNCGRVAISGGAKDTAEFDKLPDMLVANIPGHDCESPQNYDTKYPDAGDSVVVSQNAELKPPSGKACGQAVAGPEPSTSSKAPAPTSTSVNNPPATSSTLSTVTVPTTSSAPKPSSPPDSTGGNQTCSGASMLCKGTSQFGLCDNGKVVWQQVAPGTQCVNGQITKRSYRVSRRRSLRESSL